MALRLGSVGYGATTAILICVRLLPHTKDNSFTVSLIPGYRSVLPTFHEYNYQNLIPAYNPFLFLIIMYFNFSVIEGIESLSLIHSCLRGHIFTNMSMHRVSVWRLSFKADWFGIRWQNRASGLFLSFRMVDKNCDLLCTTRSYPKMVL